MQSTPGTSSERLLLTYTVIGALIGLVVLHPLTITVLWFESLATAPTEISYLDFMRSRLWLGFVPRRLFMGSVYLVLGGLLGAGFGILTHSLIRRARKLQFLSSIIGGTIPETIAAGEGSQVEFKSSVRWDMENNSTNKALEKIIAKTIAGFLNNRGGNLLIGVADDGVILGLEKDYQTLRHKNRDGFERLVTDIVRKTLGGDLCSQVHFSFVAIDGKDVCMVIVEPAPRAVYLEINGQSVFFVRSGNSTRQLDVRETVEFVQNRWH